MPYRTKINFENSEQQYREILKSFPILLRFSDRKGLLSSLKANRDNIVKEIEENDYPV
jgi:hypothetical protein